MSTSLTIQMLGPADTALLDNVASGVFDNAIDQRWTAEFLADPRHHMAVAIDDGQVVGMASAVHYVHPDKPPELWVNEVGWPPRTSSRVSANSFFARCSCVGVKLAALRRGWEPRKTIRQRDVCMRLWVGMSNQWFM